MAIAEYVNEISELFIAEETLDFLKHNNFGR